MVLELAGKQIWQRDTTSTKSDDDIAVIEVVAVQEGKVVCGDLLTRGRLYPRVNRLRNCHPIKFHCPLGGHSVGNQWRSNHIHEGLNESESGDDGPSAKLEVNERDPESPCGGTCEGRCDGPLCRQIRGKCNSSMPECAPPQTVLVSFMGAGLLPGDNIELRLVAGPFSTVEVTSSGAFMVFGKARKNKKLCEWDSAGKISRLDQSKIVNPSVNRASYCVHPGALLVIACQPLIPSTFANLLQQTTINLLLKPQTIGDVLQPREHSGGSVVLIEWISSGRKARGENWAFESVEVKTQLFATVEDDDPIPPSREERARGSAFKPAKSFDTLIKEDRPPSLDVTSNANCVFLDRQYITGSSSESGLNLPTGVGHSSTGVMGNIIMLGPRVERLMEHVEKQVREVNEELQSSARAHSLRNPSHMSVKGCDASGSSFIAELALPDCIMSTSRFDTEVIWRGEKLTGMTLKLLASNVEKGMETIQLVLAPLFVCLGTRITSKSSQLTPSQGMNWGKSLYENY